MKQLATLVLISTFAASALAGDPMAIAKQRARETSQAVSAGQAPPSHAAAAQAAPAVAPPNPALVAMQQNVSSIAGDLATLQSDASKKQPLINDLTAAAQGTNPSKTSVTKLATDLGAALNGKNLSTEQRAKLAQYLRATCNSSHVTPAQQRAILDDAQKILQAGGISTEDAGKIVADFKAIAAETK